MTEPPEVEELERTAAWRLRLMDADPGDTASAAAAQQLESLAEALRCDDPASGLTSLWTELRAVGNWLGESDAISDYAELAAAYRAQIGISEHPADGADYLRALLRIAHSLM
jgi:hypothetical protein